MAYSYQATSCSYYCIFEADEVCAPGAPRDDDDAGRRCGSVGAASEVDGGDADQLSVPSARESAGEEAELEEPPAPPDFNVMRRELP